MGPLELVSLQVSLDWRGGGGGDGAAVPVIFLMLRILSSKTRLTGYIMQSLGMDKGHLSRLSVAHAY